MNNVPHLGNIIGCVLSADIFARFCRMCGYNTLYISGTDEYGTATETKALAEKITPKEICDKYFEIHNSIYRWFGIGFDYFGRTTTTEQTEIVQEMFLNLNKSGFIQSNSVDQLLCEKCNLFLADRFVEGTCPLPGCNYEDARGDQCDKCGKLVNAIDLIKPRCKFCSNAPIKKASTQFFLDLPKIEPKLKDWVQSVENGWTSNAKIITRSWLREGLKPRCITRDLKWGIPVPLDGFRDKVFYVWFDAPIGYISITSKYTKDWKEWWQPKSNDKKIELYQFMAKDNVPFHSIMFPATLLGVNSGFTLVSHVMATEYLNYEDGKFSKSRGTGVFGNDAQNTGIPADIWRFYLASSRPENQDSSFSWDDLLNRNNSELLNNFGNFVNRALVFCEKQYNSIVPDMKLTQDELTLLAMINREYSAYIASMEKARYRDAVKYILNISRHGNQYLQTQQPWVLYKKGAEEQVQAATIIGLSCNISCLLAILVYPFMPTIARNLFDQLNVTNYSIDSSQPFMKILLKPGHKMGKPSPLFVKIEQQKIDELKMKYNGGNDVKSEKQKNAAPVQFKSLDELEKAIMEVGEKVRNLKKSGAEKSIWQPEVNILLDLKKQMESFKSSQQTKPVESSTSQTPVNPDRVKELEQKILEQGNKVRELKKSSEKSIWQPEVNALLNLKKELAQLVGEPPAPPASSSSSSGKKNKKKA